jgi:pimeloyl-ACP methyl ester carboxylesterase
MVDLTHTNPMTPWPALAPLAKVLPLNGERETIFYFDSAAAGTNTAANGAPKTAKPPIILIHGLGDEADSWRYLIPRLSAAGHRTLAPDLPGFGRSKAPGRINLRRHIGAVLRLLDETGPAILVGNSMGAIVAEGAAVERPELAKALILLDGCYPSGTALNPGLMLLALPFVGKQWYRAYRKDHEGAYRSLFGYYADLENGMSAEDREFLRERVIARVESETQEKAYFGSLRSLVWNSGTAAGRFRRGIAQYPGRLLLLWGEQDRVMKRKSADIIQKIRPDAEFALLPGVGHLPHQEKPDETAAAILRFL